MKKHFFLFMLSAIVCSLFIQSCEKSEKAKPVKKELTVVTTLYPLYDFAKNIGQEKADVSLLLPPGVEPHSFEPRPADMLRIQGSDIFIFTGAFMEPWVDKVIKGIDAKRFAVVDASKGITLMKGTTAHDEHGHGHQDGPGSSDPHIWLDLSNAMKMVDTIAAEYSAKDPQNKDYYMKNSSEYKKKLEVLDKKYKDELLRCRNRVIIHAGHFAFEYLAKRYDLQYISAYKGFTPDAEPSPRGLAELVQMVKKFDAQFIYYEELITPKIAETISKETGCGLLMLHAAHNVTKKEIDTGVNFISIMEKNLENLKVGLQCP
ncbi:MAG: metal ABC transporter substrate-binding protein [Syntrophaceae bacterium]